jgi:hypothetical protein
MSAQETKRVIFDQKGNTCSFFALANALQDAYKTTIYQVDVEDYVEACPRKEAKFPWLFEYTKEHPFMGFSCVKWQCLYNEVFDKTPDLTGIRKAILQNKPVIAVIKIKHKRSPKLHLDKNFNLVSYSGLPALDYHAVSLVDCPDGYHYEAVNSWGEFGKNGSFFIHQDQFSEICTIYTASFTKK